MLPASGGCRDWHYRTVRRHQGVPGTSVISSGPGPERLQAPASSGRLDRLAAVHLRLAWGCGWFVIIAPGKKKRVKEAFMPRAQVKDGKMYRNLRVADP
jgi:hypothetical protein